MYTVEVLDEEDEESYRRSGVLREMITMVCMYSIQQFGICAVTNDTVLCFQMTLFQKFGYHIHKKTPS